jgi:hypothetical protein
MLCLSYLTGCRRDCKHLMSICAYNLGVLWRSKETSASLATGSENMFFLSYLALHPARSLGFTPRSLSTCLFFSMMWILFAFWNTVIIPALISSLLFSPWSYVKPKLSLDVFILLFVKGTEPFLWNWNECSSGPNIPWRQQNRGTGFLQNSCENTPIKTGPKCFVILDKSTYILICI